MAACRFLRFPGGCYVEGGDWLKDRFAWKRALGRASDRPGHWNGAWRYWSSDGVLPRVFLSTSAVQACIMASARLLQHAWDTMRAACRDCSREQGWLTFAGLGLYEYMLLAEALGAEPVLVVNNGISHQEAVPPAQLGPYLQARLPPNQPAACSHAPASKPPGLGVRSR